MKTLIPALVLFMALLSCNSKDGSELITMHYAQTQCADPWHGGGYYDDAVTLKSVNHYLDSLNIPHYKANIKNDGMAEYCNSCGCTTGKRIYITTTSDYTSQLNKIGFHQ